MWNKLWIVNLDLDFFWDENNKIYDTQFIYDFAHRQKNAMGNIKVLTIALSPECVVGYPIQQKWENAVEVLNIFKKELDLSISLENR